MFCVAVLAIPIRAQQADDEAPTKLEDYRVVQYVNLSGASPKSIMGYDNNGDVLMSCRSGKTREQLEQMGVPVTDSQVKLLEVYSLLSVKDGILTTSIPILGPDQTRRIRLYAKESAGEMITHVRTDVVEFLGMLTELGRERNAYSMLFAYVFDSMAWSNFEAAGLVQPTEIDIRHPFWSGEVYAFYPRRSFSCGTNTHTRGSVALKVNWSQSSRPVLKLFYGALMELDDSTFREFMEKGQIEDDAVKETFAPFGMLDDTGRLTIPVIDETEDDALYRVSSRISGKMAEQTPALLSFRDLKKEFGFRDVQQTVVIIFHELIWELMEVLEAEGLVRKPVAFSHPEEATPKNAADLMFVVRSPE
jgi:hypothetical protein